MGLKTAARVAYIVDPNVDPGQLSHSAMGLQFAQACLSQY